jgi:hypothetical protein
MYHDALTSPGLADLVHDPLTRLVMASDGVSAADLLALMDRVRRARRAGGWPALPQVVPVGAAAVRMASRRRRLGWDTAAGADPLEAAAPRPGRRVTTVRRLLHGGRTDG